MRNWRYWDFEPRHPDHRLHPPSRRNHTNPLTSFITSPSQDFPTHCGYKIYHRSDRSFVFTEKENIHKNRNSIFYEPNKNQANPLQKGFCRRFALPNAGSGQAFSEKDNYKTFYRSDIKFANTFLESVCYCEVARRLIASEIHYSGPFLAL